jgi:hypothetical protein
VAIGMEQAAGSKKPAFAVKNDARFLGGFLIPVLSMFFEVGKRPRADISPTYTREAPFS